MGAIENYLDIIATHVWGLPLLVLILGTGIFLMIGLKFIPLRKMGAAFRLLWQGRHSDDAGEISPFNALMTSLAATIGTGNIAGVATAIFLGGPGALFWMWVTALLGMATKYAEVVCAVQYRETDKAGHFSGGPMYYIKNGLSKKWRPLAYLFALFGAIAGFGIGNTIQANAMAQTMQNSFGIAAWLTGLITLILVAFVLIGGVKQIAAVAGKLVPLMAILYVGSAMIILFVNFEKLPSAFYLIFHGAFNPVAAAGGFAGSIVWASIRFGVARGIFSNEAGLGSAPIAHACSKTNDPVKQGLIAMLGTFIDTIIICSITGLSIIVTNAWRSGANGALLTSNAFSLVLGSYGHIVVAISLAVFAFTTIIGWSLYSEKCVLFLFGHRAVKYFRVIWVLAIPLGTTLSLNFLWKLADIMNALMALPNLIALLLLSPVIFSLSKKYFSPSIAAEK